MNSCEILKQQTLLLIDDLIEVCPYENDLVLLRLYFDTKITGTQLMENVKKWVLPLKAQIEAKKEEFFFENDYIFGPLPQEKLNYIRSLLKNGVLDQSDKEALWKYFALFIELADPQQPPPQMQQPSPPRVHVTQSMPQMRTQHKKK